MAQDIVNENQKISYTNLDFSAIYSETIDLIKQLTYKWDPSISNESDPGVVLVKLSALLADKMNYNIDKNVLETFPLSVTQDGNARQLYDQLGYYMDWYVSGAAPISLNWTGDTVTETDAQGNISTVTYKIPKFTTIIDSEQSVSKRYSLIGIEGAEDNVVSDVLLTTDGKTVIALALEGLAVQYQYEGETVITAQMVDPLSRRLYFTTSNISQNGVFIKNTNQENYASWKRVNNLYENSFDELRYVFGYDSNTNTCFLEFPDNYTELFGSGIEITYLLIDPTAGDVPAGDLSQFMSPVTITNSNGETVATLGADNVKLTNYLASTGHKNVESINEAYINYKKTVGTFKTLITLRDYANYIRNRDLNLCSNAFVCDRTNDAQTSYKIMNKSNGLDNLIIKVEQVVNRNSIESTFEYTYRLSEDTVMDSSKTYYYIEEDMLHEATYDETVNPVESRYYELEGTSSLKSKDAMDPFSLKFYLLKNSIAIDSKAAYNDTFNMLNPYPDLDSVFSDTSHIEHIYEDLLPLGADSYKRSEDTEWDENKSYWLYHTDDKTYDLITSTEPTEFIGDSPAESSNVYEIDVEALMPHIVLYKAVYPIVMNVSTYAVLDSDTQGIIRSNIIKALYPALASSEMNWGEETSLEYLNQIAKNADDRIKSVTVEPISYNLHAIYYDKDDEAFKEVEVNTDLSSFSPASQRNLGDIISSRIKQDIFAKSVLAGTSQLLVLDDNFTYHLSQEFYAYEDGIRAIEPEAIIDIESDASTGLSTSSTDNYIRKTYTLKENELLSLYRPQFYTTQEFLNGVHYEYVLYAGLSANKSYKLNTGEYIIFYTPILDEDNTTLEGYRTYACGAGSIISSTFDINAQTSFNALSNFARGAVIPNLGNDKYDEYNTYNSSYVTEIQNSAFITNNKITGSGAVRVEDVNIAEIKISDKFKFFWLLNQPTYSSNENLKTFTLFDSYDSETQSSFTESINTYTLKSGEYFIYTNNDYSVPEIVGAGTTIIRNCGVDSSSYSEINNSIYYAYWGKLSQIVNNGVFLTSVDNDNNLKVQTMGLYVVSSYELVTNLDGVNPFNEGYYLEAVDEEGIVYYYPTTDTEAHEGTDYFEVSFERTTDLVGVTGTAYYVLCMREDEGAYKVTSEDVHGNKTYALDSSSTSSFEEVSLIENNNDGTISFIDPVEKGLYKQVGKFDDKYALYEGASITNNGRYATAMNVATDKNTFLEHDSLVVDRKILRNNSLYKSIDITQPSTYVTIDIDDLTFNTQELGIYEPVTYRDYYEEIGGSYQLTYAYDNGGGSSMQIGNLEGYATSSSISFTGLQGEPTAFSIMVDTGVATSATSKIVSVVFDGTKLHAQTITNTADAQVTYDSTSLSKTYSDGTLTITSNGPSFVLDAYYGVYVYGGGTVKTDVQVGSGTTSITFPELEAEPTWWSCIFKSNFGTSSGYQQVIYVAKGNTTGNISGLEMDSGAHNAAHWTASYNNGSFTITSQGTNQGGYFHQPAYYQLVEDINMFTDPCEEGYYVLENAQYIPCNDPTRARYLMHSPEVVSAKPTSTLELFNELPVTYDADLTSGGYYYKSNEVDKVYTKLDSSQPIYQDASKVPESGSTTPPLDYLFRLYVLYDGESSDTTYVLKQIYQNWHQNYSYMAPYNPNGEQYTSGKVYNYNSLVWVVESNVKKYYKCVVDASSDSWVASEWVRVDTTWRMFDFTAAGTIGNHDYQDKYVKYTAAELFEAFATTGNKFGNLYPANIAVGDEGVASYYISAPIAVNYGSLSIEDSTVVYTRNAYPTIELNTDEFLPRLFPNKEYSTTSSTRNIKQIGELKVYYLPKLHQFKDYFLITSTKYYKLKELYRRLCEQIDAWTCSALNINEIVDDPITQIGTLWATMQTNTSITIIQNEILSFGEGDTVVFQANEAVADSVNWPTFTNDETILDVGESYSVNYRRKGEDIQKLAEVSVDEYKWRGYSTLQVNLVNGNGQKLESNHSIAVYENETDPKPIAKFSGSDVADIMFQLKNPVKNTNGNFLNVYTVDSEGNQEDNAIYAFVARANGNYYKYNSYDYTTSLLFNSSGDSATYIENDTVELPIRLPGGKYLLAMNMKSGVTLEAVFHNQFNYDIKSINLDAPVVDNGSGYPTIDENYVNQIHSYRDDATQFTGNNYDYLYLDNGSDNYRLVNAPSLVTDDSYTPVVYGWYERDPDSGIYSKTDISDYGNSLLVAVSEDELASNSPYESKWYYKDNDEYLLTTIADIEPREGVEYYREPELYVAMTDIDSSIEFTIDKTDKPYTYVIEDLFKFEPNEIGDFELVREKIRKLDYEDEYNYTFTPKNNDLIINPLLAKSFFNTNHIYNGYIIPQLDFDNVEIRFITTKALS